MMQRLGDDHTASRKRALLQGLAPVAAELRLIDVVELITFVRTENHPNLGDLVNSSVELFFKPGVLQYGWGAEVELKWSGAPAVMLDMEFRHRGVTVYFRLTLRATAFDIDLHYVSFEAKSECPEENTRRLEEAIADAALPHPGGQAAGLSLALR
ncbi:MAG TPA: hypothetical protein VN240_07680 [Propylenella sp.]|nr:hypothetical protein [Propylenella sp.]